MNPNVAIELGYALKSLMDSNILMVMNSRYGDATRASCAKAFVESTALYYGE